MDGRPERRNRGSSSIFRLVQCLLFLIPYWGIFQLHKRLNLGITEEYSILQDLLEIPPILTNDVVTTTGGRYLAANTDTSRISLKGTKHKVHASLPDSYREIYRKNRQAEELREKAKSRARRYRILARQKQALRDAEREASAWHYRYDEETDAPEPEFEGIPTYVPVGKPKKQVQLEKTSNATHPSKYAYAFVMGGVNEADGKYKGMLYNILIAAYILDKEGSVADVVVYIQMSANSTRTELPEEDSALLKKVNVQVRYLPKPKIENFHQIIMQKMVVLDLVEYRRVLFLDTDVMPFCNLDYVFELSDGSNPVLKENLIIALSGSPANAGFFMLEPKPGALEAVRKIVARQQERAKDLPYPHFDERIGWGHRLRAPDKWWTINKEHTRRAWKFVGSHADQGLLYHWVKYVERSVSIVSGVEVDNYAPKNGRERVRLQETLIEPFRDYTCLPTKYEDTFGELPTYQAQGMAPYRDFIHFLGGNKPWKRRVKPAVATNPDSETPEQYWFHMLRILNHELDMGINFGNWTRIRRTPLGSLPKKHLMKQLMDANQTLVQT